MAATLICGHVVVARLPAKFSISADRAVLTVSDVCRDCADNTTDLQVIQCNASNQHGYAFTTGYLNVLRMISADLCCNICRATANCYQPLYSK